MYECYRPAFCIFSSRFKSGAGTKSHAVHFYKHGPRLGAPLLDAVPQTRLDSSSIRAVRVQSADMESTMAGLRHYSDRCGVPHTTNRPHRSSSPELNNSASRGCGWCRQESTARVSGVIPFEISRALRKLHLHTEHSHYVL